MSLFRLNGKTAFHPICLAAEADNKPVSHVARVIVLQHLCSTGIYGENFGPFGYCKIAFTDPIQALQFRAMRNLVDFCEPVPVNRADVVRQCEASGFGLVIDTRMILCEKAELCAKN